MKISNLSDIQLPVDIVGVNGDRDTVLLQPRGGVELPAGFSPVELKLRHLYVHPETQTVAPAEDADAGKSGKTTK